MKSHSRILLGLCVLGIISFLFFFFRTPEKKLVSSEKIEPIETPLEVPAPQVLETPEILTIEMPKFLDFQITPSFQVKVLSAELCSDYIFNFIKDAVIIRKKTQKNNTYDLTVLPLGIYKLRVDCYRDGEMKEQVSKWFKVNSDQIPAPKVKNKKIKLFVKILENVLGLFIPSAIADETPIKVPLSWEFEDAYKYELEIADGHLDNIVLKKVVHEKEYQLEVNKPGNYFWRVRATKDGRWGAFTEWNEVEIQDKVNLYTERLMVAPFDQEKIKTVEDEQISFEWKIVEKNFKYFLEIESEDGEFSTIIPVVESSVKTPLAPGRYKWRVNAESPFGNKNPNKEYHQLEVGNKEEVQNKELFVNAYLGRAKNEIETDTHEFGSDTDSITSIFLKIEGEYWLRKWRENTFVTGYVSGYSASGFSNLETSALIGQNLKWSNEKWNHRISGGVSYLIYRFDNDLGKVDYRFFNAIGKYFLNYKINNRHEIGFMAELVAELNTSLSAAGYRAGPVYNYNFKKNWNLKTFLTKEYFKAEVPDADFNVESLVLGLGLGWAAF